MFDNMKLQLLLKSNFQYYIEKSDQIDKNVMEYLSWAWFILRMDIKKYPLNEQWMHFTRCFGERGKIAFFFL